MSALALRRRFGLRPTLRRTELWLLLWPAAITAVGLTTIVLARRQALVWGWSDLGVSLGYLGLLLWISLSLGLLGFRGDQVLLPLTAMLAGLGLLMIQRLAPALAARAPGYAALATRQLVYLAGGLVVLWLTVIFAGRRLDRLRRYKYLALAASLGLLGVTFVFGTAINGARLWLTLGPVQVQPAELSKVTLVIFLAAYLDEKRDLLGANWRVGRLRLPPLPYLLPLVVAWSLAVLVLVAQNDLGFALLFFGVFLVMLYVASGRPLYVGLGLVGFAVAAWLAYALFSRTAVRVENWLDPWHDPLGTGYQQVQAEYALASGGLFGSGLGLGSPWYIPEVQTDYVFAALGEELGLLGSLAVAALYLLLAMRGFAIALAARDGFARLVAVGLTATLALQTFVIIGGVLRVIPLTGITLPFVSYGGSSLLTNCLIVGLLLRISDPPGARR